VQRAATFTAFLTKVDSLMGTVDYVYNRSVTFYAGYRAIHFDYSANSARGVSVHLNGPILAGTIRF
jgi:hypothetical protein